MLFRSVWRADDAVSPAAPLPTALRTAIRALTGLGLAVITIGTLVTGSGPHAGDSAEIERLPLDWRMISWLHADVAILFIGLALGVVVALHSVAAPAAVTTAAHRVVIISVGQGAIGYVQTFTHLPWVVVTLHVIGAVALWAATLRLRLAVA